MNKYSQPINAPFVPTYAPPNLGVVSQVAGDLQKQRDLSLLQHDKLEEQFVSAMGEVMEADKPMIEKQLMEMNTAFDEIHNADTFQDAKPAIRKRAMQFAKDAASGNIYKAKKNMQTMTKSVANIDGAKIDPKYKTMLKNGLLSNYKGVLEGGVIGEISNLPNYVNEADKAIEYAKDIRPTIYQELGMLPQTIMVDGEPKTIYADIEGKVTRDQKQGIATIVKDRMMGDNELMTYLSLEASLERPDDVNGYIEDKLNNAAYLAVVSQGSMQETFATLPKGTRATGSSDSNTRYVNLPGTLMASSLIPDGFDNFMTSLRDSYLKQKDEPQLFETKKSILHMALSKMVKLGDSSPKYGITVDEMNGFLGNLYSDESKALKGTPGRNELSENTSLGVGASVRTYSGVNSPQYPIDEDQKTTYNKLKSYIEESGDTVGNAILLTDDTKKKNFTNRFLDVANTRTMEIVNFDGGPEEEAKLFHEIKKNIDPINNTPKIAFNTEGVYYEVSYFDEKEGEKGADKTYLIQEKVQGEDFGDQAWRENNLTNHVANIVGGNEGKWLNTTFALRGIKAYTGKNLIPTAGQARQGDHLPPNFSRNVRMMDGSQATYLELNEDGNGTTITIGNTTNTIRPFSYVDYITSIAPDKNNAGSPNDFRNEIYRIQDEHNIFTKGEMDYMLSSGNLSQEALKKMLSSEALKSPYPFKDKIEAVSYVTSN